MLFHVFTLPGPALTLSHYFQALHCDTAPEGVPTVLSSPLRWGYAISSLRLAHWGLGQGSRCLSAGGGQQGPGAGLEILDGHLGVIVAEQAVVAGPHAGAVAVAVAATLRGTVAADEAEVAAAVVGLHTRAVHATLGAHWAAQPRHAAGRGWGSGQGSSRPLRRADLAGVRVLTASQSPPRPPTLFSTSPPRPRSVPSLPCSWVQPRTSCGSDELPLQGTLSNQRTNLPSLDQVPTSRPPPHLGLWFLASCLGPCPILNCSSQALPLHGRSGLLPSTPPEPWSSRNLTCPWCSLPCSCTRNRGAGRGSSGSRCSHGARWHIRPPGGRKERPRRPQVAHTSALT